jgi:2-hydroxy-3-oxopropionate reductase
MNNIVETAKTYNVHLPLSEQVEKFYDLMVKKGKSNLDHSALYLLLKRLKRY